MRIKRPFVLSALTLIFSYSLLMKELSDAVFAAILISAFICVMLTLKRSFKAIHSLLVCVCLIVSCLIFSLHSGLISPVLDIDCYSTAVTGEVYSYAQENSSGTRSLELTDVFIRNKRINGRMLLYFDGPYDPSPGDTVSFTANSIRASASDDLYYYHSLSDGIYLTATAYDGITITESSGNKAPVYKIAKIRKHISDIYSRNMATEDAAVTNALITGDKNQISDETLFNFRLSGVSHIFAVSGMHLSLWTGVFFIFFKSRAKVSLIPNLAAILFVVFYCVFTGFSPSVLRAGIMLITIFISRIIRRKSDSLNTWGIAGTLLLLTNPFLAGNISFLLSYSATFALIFFSEYILPERSFRSLKHLRIKLKLLSVYDSFIFSLCVTFTTLPISTVFFGYVSVISPFISLILTPIAELLMIAGGISALLPSGSFISVGLLRLCELCSLAIRRITEYAAGTDIAAVSVKPEIIIPAVTATVLLTVYLLYLKKDRKYVLKGVLTGVVILLSSVCIYEAIHIKDVTVYIPSSGNSTCITVSGQGNRSLIYGSGGEYKTARDTSSYLNRHGEFRSDYLLIPRSAKSENNNTDILKDMMYPENTINLYKIGMTKTVRTPLWRDAEIYSVTSDSFCASVLYLNGTKIVICPLPTSDFSDADKEFFSGDILICRNKLPATLDSDDFDKTVIMSASPLSEASPDIFSTADGNIEITIKDDSYAINR